MPPERNHAEDETPSPRWFTTTHWSVVLSAKDGATGRAEAALEQLCRAYWWPLYVFVRRRGHEAHDAQDLTQAFFAGLLAKDFLRAVDRSKGKFRSFLLAALEHFLAKEWRRANAQKRGGKFAFVSINDETAEQPYLQVAATDGSPEKVFDREWATTLLGNVVARLQAEYVAADKQTLFAELKGFLTSEKNAASYDELAAKLNTTKAALKMAVSRMRKRYGELLREEIGNTVSSPEEVDEELRALVKALST